MPPYRPGLMGAPRLPLNPTGWALALALAWAWA